MVTLRLNVIAHLIPQWEILAVVPLTGGGEVTVTLIKAKCLPILLYGTEACHFSVRETTLLEYPITCAQCKLFNAKPSAILANCKLSFGLGTFCINYCYPGITKRHFYIHFSTTYNALCRWIAAASVERLCG